ncbi:MAG TPA: FMN-binding protein [Levilinea sp.]|nr:FMN-binding protein [Levilinea sp.]
MKQAAHMILTLSLIGTLSGTVLALVNTWASPLIAQRAREAKEAAIFLVQPEAVTYEQVPVENLEVYRVFDEAGAPIGYSMVHSATGFQSVIMVMIGISDDLNTIIAIAILDQNETPGLGTLIKEPEYINQFKGLATTPNIAWIKGVPPDAPNEVQTITGATISSRAVVEIVDNAVAQLRALQEELK